MSSPANRPPLPDTDEGGVSSPQLVLTADAAGVVRSVSSSLIDLLGRPAADLVGQALRELTDRPSADSVDAMFAAVRERHQAGSLVLRIVDAVGNVVAMTGTWNLLTSAADGATVVLVCESAAQGLRASRAGRTHEAFQRLAQELVVTADADGTVIYSTPALRDLLGLEVADVTGNDLWDLIHPDDVGSLREDFLAVLDSGACRTSLVRVLASDRSYRWLETATANLLETSIGGVVCTLRDVTDQLAADQALRASEARYRAIADTAEEGIWALSSTGETLYINARMAALLGVPVGEAYDFNTLEQLDPRAAAEVRRRLAGREQRGPERYEFTYAHPDGRTRTFWVSATPLRREDGSVEGSLAMISDITDRRATEEQLRTAQLRDSLTRLPNRPLLVDRLAYALTQPDTVTSVLFIDLDNFKVVNDSRGHDVGDQLLVAVANRLVAAAGPHRTVARFGGDEFVVVTTGSDDTEALLLAERIVGLVAEPFHIEGNLVHVAASVGVASSTAASSPGDLLRYADAAMYSAKAAGRGRVRIFDPLLAMDVEDEYALAADLRAALAADILELHYQPIIALETGAMIGLEALARWRHPTRGPVPPARFVLVAERAGLAGRLDRWVLRRALTDMSELRKSEAVPRETVLAINLSAHTLDDASLADELLAWADEAAIAPEQVSLEITETAIMRDSAAAIALLTRFRQQGFRVAIDDFGTGYSSLAYLRDLPITTLKIDRSFIAELTTSEEAAGIVSSVLDLARVVGVSVVAEGVETAEQARALRSLGCQSGQGWWWGRAVPAADIPEQVWTEYALTPVAKYARRGVRRKWPVTHEHGLSRLLELHAVGASHTTIAAALNAEGFRTPSGHRWHAKSVTQVIIDIAYPTLGCQPDP